jgi:hypothetical protein
MKSLIKLLSLCVVAGFLFTACEGPAGPAGKDANETCTLCHNPTSVDAKVTEFELSKHGYGEAAFEEAGNTGCGPCHLSEAFKFVCKNNTSSAFAIVAPATTYSNLYATSTSKAYGEINCFTCHANLHTTFTDADYLPVTTTAAVSMTFYGGAKSIDLTQDGGISNLCVKCHQPRPFTNSNTNKNVLNYDSLKNFTTAVFYDAARTDGRTNILKPGYRTHTHYGTAGAVFAGKGGIEFTGTLTYENSKHTTDASCQDCHMAAINGKAGGHTFVAKGNFNGCTPCHASVTNVSQASSYWTTPRAEIKLLLDQLAAKLKIGGVEILNRNPDAETNLWVTQSTNKYDGYLNIYDPINNPNGLTNNPGGTFKATSTSGFSAAQITTNNSLPVITLTNAQMGAIINFQLCLRDYSLGIHNYKYTKALLTNSIAILP